MRFPILFLLITLSACGPSAAPNVQAKDATKEAWYADALNDVTTLTAGAKKALSDHNPDAAASLIMKAEPLSAKILAVAHPTFAATAAASDLDELYGHMLLTNRNYGWARLMFQKNLARWKYWQPQTPEAQARLKQARDEIAECDRGIEGPAR